MSPTLSTDVRRMLPFSKALCGEKLWDKFGPTDIKETLDLTEHFAQLWLGSASGREDDQVLGRLHVFSLANTLAKRKEAGAMQEWSCRWGEDAEFESSAWRLGGHLVRTKPDCFLWPKTMQAMRQRAIDLENANSPVERRLREQNAALVHTMLRLDDPAFVALTILSLAQRSDEGVCGPTLEQLARMEQAGTPPRD